MVTTTDMELVDTGELIPYANNARTHSDAQVRKLRASLREFGFINPVIIDRDNNVIAGHGRIEAALAEGIEKVPCVYADHLTEAQKKAYVLADNRMALDAGWDEEMLRVEIEALQAEAFDVSLTGFDESELADLFATDAEAQDDGFDPAEELERPAVTRRGDIWRLGAHVLMCGDATDASDMDALMEGAPANLVVTDPPYNVNYEGGAGTIRNDNMADAAFYEFLLAAFRNAEAHMAPDASIYVFHADTEGLNFRRAFKDAGFYLSGTCIWKKQSLVLGRSPYQWQHEPCLFGWKAKGSHKWYGDRKQTTIWEFDKPARSAEHPTMKPVPLIAHPILNSTSANAVVLDPFGGSGSTLVACEQTGRACRTMELDEKYCDVIVRRFAEYAGDGAEIHVERGGEEIPLSELGVVDDG